MTYKFDMKKVEILFDVKRVRQDGCGQYSLGCEASNGYERTLDLSVGDVSAGGNRVSPLLGNALTI